MSRELSRNAVKEGVSKEAFEQDLDEKRRLATGLATGGSRSEGAQTVAFDRLEFQKKLLELKGAIDLGEKERAQELVAELMRLMSLGTVDADR